MLCAAAMQPCRSRLDGRVHVHALATCARLPSLGTPPPPLHAPACSVLLVPLKRVWELCFGRARWVQSSGRLSVDWKLEV